jgi:hypothetical protein
MLQDERQALLRKAEAESATVQKLASDMREWLERETSMQQAALSGNQVCTLLTHVQSCLLPVGSRRNFIISSCFTSSSLLFVLGCRFPLHDRIAYTFKLTVEDHISPSAALGAGQHESVNGWKCLAYGNIWLG